LGRPRDEFDRKGRRIKAAKKTHVINVDVGLEGVEGFSEKRDGRERGSMGKGGFGGRYNVDRKIRGSGGRKGRTASQGAGRSGRPGGILDDSD
jgi:hypothetical protein